jgi:hypothetical protein
MKISNKSTQIQSNIQESEEFGMDAVDMPHITKMLRDTLYSDKLLAILREYSINALDAHKEKGIPEVPIEITFPTLIKQELRIRDFGKGLTEEEVRRIYIKYGASTKRNRNTETGGFGIGCKSAFSYSPQFEIKTYKDGIECNFLAAINANDVGTLSVPTTKTTDESNGVEITIPINAKDHEALNSKAQELFKYWDVLPKTNIDLYSAEYVIKTDKFRLSTESVRQNHYGYQRQTNYGAKLLMGAIAYPINLSALNCKDESLNSALESNNLILIAPIGSADVAASREQLEYTNKTKDQIIALCSSTVKSLAKEINDEIDKIKSPIKASNRAQISLNNLNYQLSNIVKSNLNHKGKKLQYQINFNMEVVKHSRLHRYRANDHVNKKEKDVRATSIKSNTNICVYDPSVITESNATRRVRTLQHNNNWHNDDEFFVIEKSKLNLVNPILIKEDYTDLHTVEPLPANRQTIIKSDGTKEVKVRISVCKLKSSHLKSGRITKECDPEPEEDGKYYYVGLDRYDWIGTDYTKDHLCSLGSIRNSIDNLNVMLTGKAFNPTIYGVKKHHIKNLNEDWIELKDYITSLYTKAKDKLKGVFESALMYHSNSTHKTCSNTSTNVAYSKSSCPLLSKLGEIDAITKCDHHLPLDPKDKTKLIESARAISMLMIEMELETTGNERIDLEEKVLEKYPLLEFVSSKYYSYSDKLTDALKSYIK